MHACGAGTCAVVQVQAQWCRYRGSGAGTGAVMQVQAQWYTSPNMLSSLSVFVSSIAHFR